MNNYQRTGTGTSFYGQQMSANNSQYGPNNMNPQQNYQNPQQQYNPNYQQQYNQNQQFMNNSFNQSNLPNFRLLKRGNGIDEREYNTIINAAGQALSNREDPLSDGITRRIKQNIGGEWFAFACSEGLKGYDFSLSIVTGNDFLSFVIDRFHFQVCRLRD